MSFVYFIFDGTFYIRSYGSVLLFSYIPIYFNVMTDTTTYLCDCLHEETEQKEVKIQKKKEKKTNADKKSNKSGGSEYSA